MVDNEDEYLKPFVNKRGYEEVRLFKDGVYKTVRVDRMVLETFVGRCPEGHDVYHINGIKTDNRLDNLKWVPIDDL